MFKQGQAQFSIDNGKLKFLLRDLGFSLKEIVTCDLLELGFTEIEAGFLIFFVSFTIAFRTFYVQNVDVFVHL